MNPHEVVAKFNDDQTLTLEWLAASLEEAIRERFREVGSGRAGAVGVFWLPARWEKITQKSLFNKLVTFDLSVVSGVYLLNVTSSIPNSFLKSHNKPIRGSPIVPVPTTCTIFLDISYSP